MATKKCYYIGVQTDEGMKFVTSFERNYAHWDSNEKPMKMAKSTAQDIVFGLNLNLHNAVVIESNYEQVEHWTCGKCPF